MPGSLLQSPATSTSPGGCPSGAVATTGSIAQNIHGVTPAVSSNAACVNSSLDYSSTQYGHNFFVDAPPGTGDLFYPDSVNPAGAWHTWLVGGLGAGGAAIYALDVTNPDPTNFAESNAANIVIGEWNSSTITCSGNSACGTNMGNSFGIPQIRRFHNGAWGMVFGNGLNSATGDAGIFVMTIDPTSGMKTFYYFSTGQGTLLAPGTDGIAYTTPVDLDGDHVTDYVYAGDVKGNVWRFDLTSNNPSSWGTPFKVFSTGGQPITSKLVVVATVVTGSAPRVMVEFGTGQKIQLTNTAPASYATGTQDIYGVWDWNMSGWNAKGSSAFDALAASVGATGLASPYTLAKTNLTQQTLTVNSTTLVRDGSNTTVCWKDASGCATNDKFGWYIDLPGSYEQIVFNPIFYQGALIIDSTVPANNTPTSCTANTDKGFTYAVSATTGGAFTSAFPKRNDTLNDTAAVGVETDATGSPYVVTTAEGTINLVYQTVTGTPGSDLVNLPSNVKATRLTWVELR
jgi:type IV pilus assembly protein PilY1